MRFTITGDGQPPVAGKAMGNRSDFKRGQRQRPLNVSISLGWGEEHPTWFMNLHNNEKIRTWFPGGRDPLPTVYRDSAPDAPVLWYSAGSNGAEDSFFTHGHFYNPTLPSNQLYNGSTSSPSMMGDAQQAGTALAAPAALITFRN